MAEILFNEGTAPDTPASGKVSLYAKADSLLYFKDDTGTETAVGTPSGAGLTQAQVLARIAMRA